MTTESVSIAGEILLNKLYIVRGDGKSKVDLTGMMLELDLYEDIFSNSMSGSITVTENFNLIHNLPIIGEEWIEIEFKTPSINKLFSKVFFLYKIGRQISDGNSKNVYLLNIISEEALKDLNTKISKSFSGTPDSVVNGIFKKYLYGGVTKVETSPATNFIKFVSPYWSPFKCINYAASQAMGTDKFKTPSYLFFETNQSFKFKSLNELMKKEPITEYFYDRSNLRDNSKDGESTRDIDREYKTAENFDIINAMDYIDRLMNGVYSFKVFDVNILNKTISKKVYNYWDNFEETNHLSENPAHSEYVTFDNENGRIEWKVTNPYMHDEVKKDFSAEIISKRIPLLAQTEMFTIEITVPGRLGIEVGDTVKFNMLNYEKKDSSDKSMIDYDLYYSGKYLVTSIEHRITQSRHKMNMHLIKESFENPVEFQKEI